ncbi:hypothetical protein [Actinospongicola halichondriae]|uniref:hypothetical protein n=1 Tax=Actinospongicola halichondriae TaxID=3236844 RepID=UPI003D3ABB88
MSRNLRDFTKAVYGFDAVVRRNLTKAGDALRVPGMFGPEVEAPADATPAEAFIAFAGRNPRS